jgi:hypothetical protein
MSEQAILFLLSLAAFVGALVAAAWLMVTNQVGTIDGLFLFCSSLVIGLAFGLYLRWMVRLAMRDPHRRSFSARGETPRTTQNAEATAVLSNVR